MTSSRTKSEQPKGQFRLYGEYVIALVQPGLKLKVLQAHKNEPASLETWKDDELALIVEEGRRQLDSQAAMRNDLRTRAQWIVTVGIPVVVAIASAQPTVWQADDFILKLLWSAGLFLAGYGVLGSAAILTVRLEYGTIDTLRSLAATPRLTKSAG